MAYVKKVRRDNAQYDIKAMALDAALDATLIHTSNLVNGFTQTTPGVNALDAAAGKSLNDSLSNCATKTDLADCVRMPYVTGEIPANSTKVNVTASVPSGYSFIGWCYCASIGWLGHVYASTNSASTTFYTSSGSSSSARQFNAFYIVRKNA